MTKREAWAVKVVDRFLEFVTWVAFPAMLWYVEGREIASWYVVGAVIAMIRYQGRAR